MNFNSHKFPHALLSISALLIGYTVISDTVLDIDRTTLDLNVCSLVES